MDITNKIKFLIDNVISWIIILLAPLVSLASTLLLLVVINMITGYKKNNKLHNEKFSTAKARKGVQNYVWYLAAILATHLYDIQFINTQGIFLAKLVTGGLALIELKSIHSNVHILTGINIWDMIKSKIQK